MSTENTLLKSIGRRKIKQAGLSIWEIVGGLAVMTALAAIFWPQISSVVMGNQINGAYSEINTLLNAGASYRQAPANGGLYTSITVEVLNDNGYNVGKFDDGVNENVFGETVSVAAANSNTDMTLTYVTDSAESCLQLVQRYTNDSLLKSAPSCSTATLTLTID